MAAVRMMVRRRLLHIPDGLGRGLVGLRALEVARGDGVHDEGGDGGQHGDEAGERERLPRPAEARRVELLKGFREDVHERRGEDDAGGEALHDEEEVGVRAQGGDPPAERGDRAADGARDEDAEDGDDLELQRTLLVVVLLVFRLALAFRDREQGERGEGEEEEEGRELAETGSHLFSSNQREICVRNSRASRCI